MKCSRTACHSHNLTHKHTSIHSPEGGPNVYCEGCAKKINQVNGQTLLVELTEDDIQRLAIDPADGRPYVGFRKKDK